MTSSETGGGRDERAAPTPRGIAASVSEISSKRPPPPKGKGIAMVVIGIGVVIAVILTFVLPNDLEERWKREAEHERMAEDSVAPPAPTEAGDHAVPAAAFPVPEGLSEPVKTRLQEALNGITGQTAEALGGLRRLPTILREAPPEDRRILEPYLVETLTAVGGSSTVGPAALDAATELVAADVPHMAAVIAVARTKGLQDDATTPAALALLDVAGEAVHQDSAIAVLDLARDAKRPLHLRVLAGRLLAVWGVAEARRKELAEAPATPEALKRALR